jgi:hypothetical protein
MPKRSRKKDFAQTALHIAEKAKGGSLKTMPKLERKRIMAQMGRIGGRIGGKKRAQNMTPEARRASASLAARARWNKSPTATVEVKREEGLRKIAQLLEQQMTDMGLNEDEKNEKTQALVESVNAILGTKKQGSAKQQQSPRTVASRV